MPLLTNLSTVRVLDYGDGYIFSSPSIVWAEVMSFTLRLPRSENPTACGFPLGRQRPDVLMALIASVCFDYLTRSRGRAAAAAAAARRATIQ